MPSALALPVLVVVLVTVLTGAGFSDPSSSVLPGVHKGVNNDWAGLIAWARARMGTERGQQQRGQGGRNYRGGRRGSVAEETTGQH